MSKRRQSNIELLRIIAMLMILMLHAIGAIGPISAEERLADPLTSFLRVFGEQFCIIGVNLFVLISGWFGIRCTPKGLLNLFFQLSFFSIGIAVFYLLFRQEAPSGGGIKDVIISCLGIPYWFIPAYIILFILSPILNNFADTADKKTFSWILLAFFLAQLLYGRFGDQGHFHAGYSALSFIGLYLLSRYCRLYPNKWLSLSGWINLAISLSLILFASCYNHWTGDGTPLGGPHSTFDYNHPIVIISALYFFLAFTKLQLQSNLINWFAISAFSIYIIHMNFLVKTHYRELMVSLFNRYPDYRFFIISILTILLIGLICILIDKIRIIAWEKGYSLFTKKA